MNTKPLYDLHTENMEFLKKLDFYNDEIFLMKKNLSDKTANIKKEQLPLVEHFQNQLTIQKNNIDELRHSIKDHEDYIEHRVNENENSVDHRQLNDHPVLRSNMAAFEKGFNNLRHEFNSFLEK